MIAYCRETGEEERAFTFHISHLTQYLPLLQVHIPDLH